MNWQSTRVSLLARVRNFQDETAWREFDAQYGELILRYGRRRGLSLCEAEDVRQMVWLGLLRVLEQFRYDPAKGRFRGYLGQTVRHAVHRYSNSRNQTPSLTLEEWTRALENPSDDGPPAVDEEWESEWRRHHLRKAFAVIRDDYSDRSVRMFQRLLRGDRVDEVARDFETTAAAVYKLQQRLKARLRRQIEKQVEDEDRLCE